MQADVAVFVITDESMWADGTAFDVTGKITNGGVAAADVLELHVPGFAGEERLFGYWWQVCKDCRMLALKSLAHEVAETRCERRVVNEECFILGMDELFFIWLPCECGNDAVDVRMVLELTTPGVEHAGEAGLGSVGFGCDHIAQGDGALFEDGVVEFLGMGEAGLAQFCGDRESHHEIRNGKEFRLLLGGPELLFERAALWTGTVVAAVVGEVRFGTIPATVESPAQRGGAARKDTPHRPVMGSGEVFAVGTGVVLPVRREDVGQSEGHGFLLR